MRSRFVVSDRLNGGFRYVQHVGHIPKQWDVAKIGDLFDVQLGKMLSQASQSGEAYHPYLGNWNVQWGTFDLSHVGQMDFTNDELGRFQLRPGDLLVCEGGEVGRTAIWNGEIEGCCFQKALHRLRPKNGRMLPAFFMHYMQEAARQNIFRRYTNESSFAHLTRETLVEVSVPVPGIAEQRRILDVLTAVDDAIGQTRAVIEQTLRVKMALLHTLVAHGLPRRRTKFRKIRLGEVFQERKERGRPGLPIMAVTMNNGLVDRASLDRRMETTLESADHLLARKGDIAYNMMRMWQGVFGLARRDCLVSPAYVVVKPIAGIVPEYAAYLFKHPAVIRKFHLFSQGLTDDRLRLYFDQFKTISLEIATNEDEQRKIAALLEAVDSRVGALVAYCEHLSGVKQALGHVLLTGKLRVNLPVSKVTSCRRRKGGQR